VVLYLRFYNPEKFFRNNTDVIRITFREGLNILETANILEKNEVIPADIFLEACNSDKFENFDFIKNQSNVKEKIFRLEGYLFPDTYDFEKNEDAVSVINKFLNNFKIKISEFETGSENMKFDEKITIASVLQSESSEKEAAKVASVIYNRLNTLEKGGKSKFGEYSLDFLQLDSTVWYPYRTRGEAPSNFERKYDTYLIKGLTPGAVCSPGIEFIRAALYPEITDYFYFCNDAEGNIFYAKTFEEHKNNLRNYGAENKK
jgi:UPF0755 protein